MHSGQKHEKISVKKQVSFQNIGKTMEIREERRILKQIRELNCCEQNWGSSI
jgi:hypothetical protein